MGNYTPVIGLEVHLELNTKSKMFCGCSANYFGQEPNTHTCPVCLGLPGALPYINQEAIRKCLMIGIALGCKVSEVSRFERKNYFYPDLPKGYQISQYRWPLMEDGRWKMEDGKEIRINRVHQEEDTAKLVHQFGTQNSKLKTQNYSGIDFNRSGVPLVEIVTEPDFTSSEQVRVYAKQIQQLVRYLGVSGADMEKGQLRLEANVSVKGEGESELPDYRIELKNINSFSFMVKAIEFEIRRQSEELEKGTKLTQQTRGWNEVKGETFAQREKEQSHDYRYFPEPDLPELRIKSAELRIREQMPELPWEAQQRLLQLGISVNDARILTLSAQITEYFEEAVKLASVENIPAKDVANLIINNKTDIANTPPRSLVDQIIQKGAGLVSDEAELRRLCEQVIVENPGLAETFKKGKTTVIQALIGTVMKKTEGKADATKVKVILQKLLTAT